MKIAPWRLVLPALALAAAGCQDLPVKLAGCAVVRSGPVCEVDPEARELRLFVETSARSRILVFQGARALPTAEPEVVSAGRLLRVQVRPGAGDLRVVQRDGGRLRARRLALSALTTAPWLRDARAQWYGDQGAAAAQVLRGRLGGPLPSAERAEALGMLGAIAREQHELTEAKALLQRALVADREAGLHSNEAQDALALAALLAVHEHQVDAAERVLLDHAAAFQRVPEHLPWVSLQRAGLREARGELPQALALLDEGARLARQTADRRALGALRQYRADVLHAIGRVQEANDELAGLAAQYHQHQDHCLEANTLGKQGWLRLQALESRLKGGPAVLPPERDPAPPLLQALALRRARCRQTQPIAGTLTKLAWTALLRGDVPSAQRWLLESRAAAPRGDEALQRPWELLDGQIALLRAQEAEHPQGPQAAPLFAEAERAFRGLLRRLAAARGAPDGYEAGWRARVGLAQALAGQGRDAEAEGQFRRAEAYLERRGLELRLGEVRSGYLGRHQQGTAAYLEFLVDRDRGADALRVLRQSLARGLRGLVRLARLGHLDEAQRRRWQEATAAYQQTREALDRLSERLDTAPMDEDANLKEQQRALEHALAERLEASLRILGEPSEEPPRPVAQGEVLLACHPLRLQWLCLLARGGAGGEAPQVFARRLDPGQEPDESSLPGLLAEQLPLLAGARRLSVLPYGQAMEQLDIASLPVDGQALEDRVPVVYALDLPVEGSMGPIGVPAGAVAPAAGRALVITDPLGEMDPSLRPALAARPAGAWQVTMEGFGPQATATPGGRGLPTARVLARLAEADLFAYFGHGVFDREPLRRRLKTSEDGGLHVADVLTLPRGPRAVVLVGCSTGQAAEQVGGVAGLGLAQAFLVKGQGFVIAATRPVSIEAGSAMAEALVAPDLAGLVAEPALRLRAARRGVRAQHPAWSADVAAFRVLVP